MAPVSSGSFGGILPAVVTPFDGDGRFRPEPFRRLLGRLYEAGADGVYLLGSTGEGMLQPAAQRRAVVEAAVEHSPGGRQVIVHVGSPSVAEAAELARHAGRAGAAAVSSLPPVGGYSFPEIRDYYARIADAAGVPLFLYYYPEVAPSLMGLDQILELCALPGVGGIKLTDFDLYRLWVLKREGVTVFNGRDEILVAGLLMGADGGIGTFYNLLPADFVQLFALTRRGEWDAARAVQDRVDTLVRVVSGFPLFPAVKQILQWQGVDCGPCLAPRGALAPERAERLRAELRRTGLEEALLGGGSHG